MKIQNLMTIDDSEGDQMLAKRIIEEPDLAINVIQAYDGQEGLDTLLAESSLKSDVFFRY
jgi:hypothetical protein